MQCPVDGENLMMTARSGVEIDYCPKCRGIWLDRGELDKIIDRAASDLTAAARIAQPRATAPGRDGWRDDPRDHRDAGRQDHRGGYRGDDYRDDSRSRRRKRESFLSDLFDFD